MLFKTTQVNLSASAMRDAIARLRVLLSKYGIQVREDSALVCAFEKVDTIGSSEKLQNVGDSGVTQRQEFRKALSAEWFAEKLVLAETSPDFESLIPHIKLLAETENFAHCAPSPADQQDDELSNKLLELQVAVNVISVGSELMMDDPIHSKGNNPDILFRFEGRNWGIACKNLRSKHPRQFRTNILRGVCQLEKAKVEQGIVFIGAKELIEHDVLYEERIDPGTGKLQFHAWPDTNSATSFLRRHLINKLGLDVSISEHQELRNECLRTNTYPIIIASTVVPALVNGETRFVQINATTVPAFIGPDAADNVESLEHMRKFRRFLDLYGMPAMVISA